MTAAQNDPRALINIRFRHGDDAKAARYVKQQYGFDYSPDALRAWRLKKNNSRRFARHFADAYNAVQKRTHEKD